MRPGPPVPLRFMDLGYDPKGELREVLSDRRAWVRPHHAPGGARSEAKRQPHAVGLETCIRGDPRPGPPSPGMVPGFTRPPTPPAVQLAAPDALFIK